MLIDDIKQYGIYSNQQLKDFICDLEIRYNVRDGIELFRDLVNFSKNNDTKYHGWFKYREGFSHILVKELLKRSGISHDEYVLDPFCGSGTTVVEAALNGYCGIGIDINPVSSFISDVKCRSYTDDEVCTIDSLVDNLPNLLETVTLSQVYKEKYKEVEKFFGANNFNALLTVRQAIDSQEYPVGKKIYELLLCAYICIIEDVSDRGRDGNGLKTKKSKIKDVFLYYTDKLKHMVSDIKSCRISGDIISIIDQGNAMRLSETVAKYAEIVNKDLGIILYSPPYANSFDYFESYKMEVILADFATDMRGVSEYRQQAIESFIGRSDQRFGIRNYIDWMSQEIEAAIPEKEARTGKPDSRTRKVPKMIKGYFTDMERVIAESSRVLSSGKKCYIVVDQSAYIGKIVPTDLFLAAIAENYGFRVNDIIVCRKAKTSGQQIQRYPYLKKSLRESIVVLEKI